MRWYWKIAVVLCALVVLAILADIGLNAWIRFQLPKIINEKNNSAYAITYKNLEVSIWNNSIDAKGIIIIPKAALKDTVNKAGIYAKVESVAVRDFRIWPMLFSQKIKARSISVHQPKVTLYKKTDKKINHSRIRDAVVAPFEQIVSVTDIFLHHGDLKIIYAKSNRAMLSVQNINMSLDGVVITEDILKRKIPFSFKNYRFDCDSVYYRMNDFYHVRTKKINTTNSALNIHHFEMVPEYTRQEFVKRIPVEKDLFTLSAGAIAVRNMDWGFKSDDFFIHTDAIVLNQAAANIYRGKMPPDDKTKKHLYNKLLRDLDFDLRVDTLKVRNSIIEYEEEKDFKKGAGKITLSRFNLTAMNICSGFKKEKLADLRIKINCQFMNASPLDVNWRLNVMDKSDGFNINGTIANFDVSKIVPFTKPYMNVTTKGTIDQIRFNFTGNDLKDHGVFAVEYDDLKFTVFQKKNPKKKNKVLTFIGNLFVKNDTKDKLKSTEVEVERIPEKSFYNFLWRSIAEGLKKILI
jgi:hypothetical protein